MRVGIAFALAFACALAACGKQEEAAKPATAGLAPTATTPGTPPPGWAPGATTQPTSAEPGTDKPAPGSGIVVPRNIALGNAIGPDKKVSVGTDTFTAKETAYLSVDFYGKGEGKARTAWTYKGPDGKEQLLKADNEIVTITEPRSVEFHLNRAEGLSPGAYQVDLFVNEALTGRKKFTVK